MPLKRKSHVYKMVQKCISYEFRQVTNTEEYYTFCRKLFQQYLYLNHIYIIFLNFDLLGKII